MKRIKFYKPNGDLFRIKLLQFGNDRLLPWDRKRHQPAKSVSHICHSSTEIQLVEKLFNHHAFRRNSQLSLNYFNSLCQL